MTSFCFLLLKSHILLCLFLLCFANACLIFFELLDMFQVIAIPNQVNSHLGLHCTPIIDTNTKNEKCQWVLVVA